MNKITFLFSLIFAAILGGIFSLIAFEMTHVQVVKKNDTLNSENFEDPKTVIPSQGSYFDFSKAAERIIPAVVHIQTFGKSSQRQAEWQQRMEEYFGFPQGGSQQIVGSGSGVIFSTDGYIATNAHVLDGAEDIVVILSDKRRYDAQLIGKDYSTDLAVLKIEAEELAPAKFGDSDEIRVGEWVVAVGNPFDLTSTVTAGILSAKGRNINILRAKDNLQIEAFLQTDAAVNPGNSGGPLVNTSGELIGINTAIATRTGSFSGYSFAVPSALAQKVIYDLKEFGEVKRAVIGVRIQTVDARVAKKLQLARVSGVLLTQVMKNSAGDEAGLQENDVIVKINQHDVPNTPRLQELIARQSPGDELELTYIRAQNVE